MSNVVELRPEFNARAEKLERKSKRVKILEKQLADAEEEIEELEEQIGTLEANASEAPNEEEFCSMREEIEQAEKELSEMRDNMIYRRRVYTQTEFKEAIEIILDGFNRIS